MLLEDLQCDMFLDPTEEWIRVKADLDGVFSDEEFVYDFHEVIYILYLVYQELDENSYYWYT